MVVWIWSKNWNIWNQVSGCWIPAQLIEAGDEPNSWMKTPSAYSSGGKGRETNKDDEKIDGNIIPGNYKNCIHHFETKLYNSNIKIFFGLGIYLALE